MNENLDLIRDHIFEMIDTLIKASKTRNSPLVLASLGYMKQCLDFLISEAVIKSKEEYNEESLDEEPSEMQIQVEKENQTKNSLKGLPSYTFNNKSNIQMLNHHWLPILNTYSSLSGD